MIFLFIMVDLIECEIFFFTSQKFVYKYSTSYSPYDIHKNSQINTMSKPSTLVMIDGVKPLRNNWKIRVKVLHCWKQNTGFGDDTFECILSDESVLAFVSAFISFFLFYWFINLFLFLFYMV